MAWKIKAVLLFQIHRMIKFHWFRSYCRVHFQQLTIATYSFSIHLEEWRWLTHVSLRCPLLLDSSKCCQCFRHKTAPDHQKKDCFVKIRLFLNLQLLECRTYYTTPLGWGKEDHICSWSLYTFIHRCFHPSVNREEINNHRVEFTYFGEWLYSDNRWDWLVLNNRPA